MAAITFLVIKSLLTQADYNLSKITFAIILLISGILINFTIYFGINTMDHYSLRRVEFKKAVLWFEKNSKKNEKILMTELNVPKYYLGSDRLIAASSLKYKNFPEVLTELKNKNIKYIFVDDFYIRRLKINDKNAIERNAELMKKFKNESVTSKDFKIVKEFDVKGKKGYMLKLLR